MSLEEPQLRLTAATLAYMQQTDSVEGLYSGNLHCYSSLASPLPPDWLFVGF